MYNMEIATLVSSDFAVVICKVTKRFGACWAEAEDLKYALA